MIAQRRIDVAHLNHRARERFRAAGLLADDRLEIGGRDYAVGGRVVARHNDRRAVIANGMRGSVSAIDH